MEDKIIIVALIIFLIASLGICFFVEPLSRKKKTEFEKMNKSAQNIMPLVHNRNSGEDVQSYKDAFDSVEGFKPNYIGWK